MNKVFSSCCFGLLLVLIIVGCSKDKFATKPSLKFKSISSYDIGNKQLFEIRLEYTDAEGDLSVDNDALSIRRIVSRCKADTGKFPFILPAVPETKNSSGEIVIRFANNTLDYINQGYGIYAKASCVSSVLTDTTTFLFSIKDKAGNISDTITTDRPVLIRGQ
jgi:hypothetical protein